MAMTVAWNCNTLEFDILDFRVLVSFLGNGLCMSVLVFFLGKKKKSLANLLPFFLKKYCKHLRG